MGRKKFQHLTYNDRLIIEKMLRKKYKPDEIAKVIGCCRATIYNEIKRGAYIHHTGYFWKSEKRYSSETAHERYEDNLKKKGKGLKIWKDTNLATYIEREIKENKYSPAAVLMQIESGNRKFNVQVKSVNTIYKYIKEGVFKGITMGDCPYRVKKKKKKKVQAKSAPKGTSIDNRPDEVNDRNIFGHWEMDTVKGQISNKKNLLVLTERKTRQEIIELLKDGTTDETVKALNRIEKRFGSNFFKLFKTITVDNGTEFSDTQGMEKALYRVGNRTDIYYCHPYRSCERGSNENQNKLIRRHYPKGSNFDEILDRKGVKAVEHWINKYPRKYFGGKTSKELFEEECKAIGICIPKPYK